LILTKTEGKGIGENETRQKTVMIVDLEKIGEKHHQKNTFLKVVLKEGVGRNEENIGI